MRRVYQCICNPCQISAISYFGQEPALEPRLELVRSFPKGLENAEACNGISKADFKSKSFIALKEARESLYWIELLHRNNFIDDRQYESIYGDCEELVKVLHHRCKKINDTE